MNVLVTGGAGFIGSAFLTLSVPRYPEHRFINIDKLTYAANPANLEPIAKASNYEFELLDIVDFEAVMDIFARYKPELVVHFAAESHVDRSILAPRAFVRSNIEGTFNLLEASRATWSTVSGQHFHHVSTDEVYGSLGETGRFTEASPYDPSSPYSASKAASDHLVRSHTKTFGLPATITNSSNTYGPRQFPEKLIPRMLQNALERKPLPLYGRGLNVRDWLYVDDHCEAIWAVIQRGRLGETYNVGGNAELPNVKVVEHLCRILAKELGCPPSELTELVTFVADRPGHDLRYAMDSSKILRDCGWVPRETFTSGLLKTVRWYLQNQQWVEQVRTGEYRAWLHANYAHR